MKFRIAVWFVAMIVIGLGIAACKASVSDVSGPSASGKQVAVTAQAGAGGLLADGASQASVRVEVYDAKGMVQDAATVSLTSSLGTLGSKSLTTANGVATTTLTSGTVPGTAYIVATVENTSATTAVAIVNVTKKVT
jgi:hypothetical protein